MGFFNWLRDSLAEPSPCNKRLPFEPAPPGPPAKPQPTGGRLIYCDRDPGPVNRPVPPVLPDDLADLPELTAEDLDGAAAAPAPAEMPSDEQMERWVQEARRVHTTSGYHINASTAMARLAIAWARQQQAQSLQIPPPGAEPVATDGELWEVDHASWGDDARRALYARGRADERTAILRALGVQP